MFGYEISVFLNHKKLIYTATTRESQRGMCWQIVLEDFGSNIQYIAVVENIVADVISRFMSTSANQDEPSTSRAIGRMDKLFATRELQIVNDG